MAESPLLHITFTFKDAIIHNAEVDTVCVGSVL